MKRKERNLNDGLAQSGIRGLEWFSSFSKDGMILEKGFFPLSLNVQKERKGSL
jgi:hypothetical protein